VIDLSLLTEAEKKSYIESLPLRGKIKCGHWPEYLSIKEICDLIYPVQNHTYKPVEKSKVSQWREDQSEAKKANEILKGKIILACEQGNLAYEGNIKGWSYFGVNPHSLAKDGKGKPHIPSAEREFYHDNRGFELGKKSPTEYSCYSHDCTIHKDNFKLYLQNITDGIPEKLKGWFGIINIEEGDVVKQNRTAEWKEPKSKDGWYDVIWDMVENFKKETGRIPNQTQAWSQLCTNPPYGYGYELSMDKGEPCLKMHGVKPLSLSAFKKRWDGYT